MFDPHKRRIAYKAHAWDRIRNGELMTLTVDLETSGIGRQNVPYATPGYPFITEWGDCLTDLAGNYLNSACIKPRRPEWLAFEPAAAILQRVRDMGPELFDGEDRMNYWHAMAAMVWRSEQAVYAYEEMAKTFGDTTKVVNVTDFNKSLSRGEVPGQVKATEEVYEIPLKEADGRIVYDVRYHPERRKVSYRFHRDGNNWESKQYQAEDNLYYRDDADGSLWKWADPSVTFDGFNFNRYDLPILRSNLYRAGFSSANTTMFYSRSTPTSKQRKKPHLIDIRDMAFMVSMFGDQGEAGLKLGELEDPVTGRIRRSEALGAYHRTNRGQAIPGRLLRGGPFDPTDGSYFDLKLAHGAVADAAATAALRNFCWDISPDLCSTIYAQSDPRKLYETLTAQSPDGNKLPLFSLPRREAGLSHSEMPYWFLGTDDQIGRFGKLIFLKADGSFHKATYKAKLLKDLSVDEWVEFLKIQQERRDPDRPVRTESIRRWPGALPVDTVLSQTAQAERYRGNIDAMILDSKYIAENQDMCERIVQAMAVMNHQMRFAKKGPHNELLEDALARKYGAEIYFQEEERVLEQRMIWQRTGRSGAQKIHGILQTIKGGMDNDFKYLSAIDESLDQLYVTAHPIDWFMDSDLGMKLHEEDSPAGREAAEVLKNYTELVERILRKFKASHQWPYLDVFQGIINPATGEPYIKGGKFRAETVGQAYMFRQLLGERALKDFETLFRLKNCPYLEGYTGTDFCEYRWGERRLMIHADADNGQTGATPHVIDQNGNEIPLSVLKGLNSHIGNTNTMKETLDNLLGTGKWRYRFYRDRTEPGIMRLMHRFVTLGLDDKLPPGVRQMYEADFINRMDGMTHDDTSTDRIPTLRTMEHECKRISMAATKRDPRVLERDPNPLLTAADALKAEEGQQRLAYTQNWIRAQKNRIAKMQAPGHVRRTDPDSGMPLDYIPITIPRNSGKTMEADIILMMDVPIWHMRAPVEQDDKRLPGKFLVVPAMRSSFRDAVNRKNGAKPVLVRGIEDGRVASIGRRSRILDFDQTDQSLANVWHKVQADYRNAGIKLDDKSRLWVVAVEDIYPVAGTKTVDWGMRSLKLPKAHFDALVAPRYANMGEEPLTAVLMPLDYFPQRIRVGEKVRLRQMDTDMFTNIHGETDAPDTGHTYETKITKVFGLNKMTGKIEGIKRSDFLKMVEKGKISKKYLEAAGFVGGSIQHVRQVLDGLVTAKWKDKPDEMPLVLVAFRRVNEAYFKNGRQEKDNTYAYAHLTKPPHAAFEWDGEPVTPDMYYQMDLA